MPIKRQFTDISIVRSVAQLLVALQVDGHLDRFETPDWATGTSVEELLNAVRALEDGEWLEGVYPDHGLLESGDCWLGDFMNGKAVVTKEEAADMRAKRKANLENERIDRGLMEYVAQAKETRAAFAKKLAKPKFRDLARRCYSSLGVAVATLVFEKSDAAAKAMEDKFVFLEPTCLKDPDLVALALTYLSDDFAGLLEQFDASAVEAKRANKRAKTLVARIKAATAMPA